MSGPDIYQYTDYRTYLADFYRAEKQRSAGFSYRTFARKAKLASSNYLKLVIDGKRPITQKNEGAFLRGLDLSGSEAQYFRNLVAVSESADESERAACLEKVLRLKLRKARYASQVDKDRWEILRSWHHWAVREMVLLRDFQADGKWISARLGKKITPAQAEESIELLLRLQFLRKDPSKRRLVQSDPLITTTDEISNVIIQHLHRQFVELGLISLFHDRITDREVNGLTISLRAEHVPVFKRKLKKFRKELNGLFSGNGESDGEQVYHLQTMFFPLTKLSEAKDPS